MDTRRTVTAALALALPLTVGFPVAAEDRPPAQDRPVALGVRFLGRAGDYTEGGLGGQLRLRVHPLVAISLFTDHFAGSAGGAFRHDHEVGGTLQLTVLHGRRGALFPLVGACASLAVVAAPQGGATATDVRAGGRVGLGGILDLGSGFAVEALIEAIAYVGHPLQAYRWTAATGPDLAAETVGQLTVALDYAF